MFIKLLILVNTINKLPINPSDSLEVVCGVKDSKFNMIALTFYKHMANNHMAFDQTFMYVF